MVSPETTQENEITSHSETPDSLPASSKRKRFSATLKKQGLGMSSHQLRNESGSEAKKQNKQESRAVESLEINREGFTLSGILLILLILTFLFSLFFYMNIDTSTFSISFIISRVSDNIRDFFGFATGTSNNNLINFRVYRTLIIVLSGMGLAAAGAVYKAVFRNTLASPDVMGVQSGGNLGNVLFVLLVADEETLSLAGAEDLTPYAAYVGRNLQGIMIFAACFISVILLSLIASTAGKGRMSSSALVLTGTIFSAIIGTFVSMIQFQLIMEDSDSSQVEIIKNMSLGTFDYAARFEQLVTMSAIVLPCLLILRLFSGRMNLYSLGDEEAEVMGMNVRLYKSLMILISTALVAVVMGYCGHIAFIAFLVPQIARKIGPADFRQTLTNSILIGGILMLVVYNAAAVLKMTDALNVLTTTIGGIVMVIMLVGKRGDRSAIITQ